MIQKCPQCGQWCETEDGGMLKRFTLGWEKSVENAAEFVGGESNSLGHFVGGAIGGYTGLFRGGFESLFGDKYHFTCPNCGFEWGTDDENDDETEDFLKEQRYDDEVTEEIDKQIKTYREAEQYQEAVNWLEGLLKDPDYNDYYSYILREIAFINYNDIDDYEAACNACTRGLKLLINEPWSYDDSFLYFVYYRAEYELGHIWHSRGIALILSQNATDEKLGDKLLKDIAWDDFNKIDEEYSEIFLQMNYKDRKALLIVPSITNDLTTNIDEFRISNLPQGISFPVGHPVENHIYIGHPYLPELYLPIETYQYAFVEDKVREFCELAQALGAVEITVEALNTSNTSKNGSRDRRGAGGASYSGNSVNASGHSNETYGSLDEKYQTLNFHQEYEPSESVHLPDNLVWYPHETGWQRLYQQRLKGILSHEERIETRKSQVLSASELKEIKGEVKSVFEANGEWEDSMEEMFAQEDNAILYIKVRFAPLSQLSGNTSQPSRAILPAEQEYLDEIKLTLEDGQIGPRERKALERARVRLGISESRAAEIEASVSTSNLTNEEKEYLDEVKSVLEDGKIGPRERKFLERCRLRLGISEDRAKEIELML